MGTSSMNNGHNRSRLIPDDFDDGNRDDFDNLNSQDEPENYHEEKDPEQEPKSEENSKEDFSSAEIPSEYSQYPWTSAKSYISKLASGKRTYGTKKAVSNYVRAYGGSRNAAKTAKSAIRTTINIGSFFGGVSKKGITEVLNEHQIPIEGRKAKEILNDIVNLLAPIPSLRGKAVARKALVNAMSNIYELFEDESTDISVLDSINQDFTITLIEQYFISFIYERLINDLGSRIETNAENSIAAARIEREIKEYIKTKVSTTLRDKPLSSINSSTKNVSMLVESLYQQCYKVLEDQL